MFWLVVTCLGALILYLVLTMWLADKGEWRE